VSGCVPAFGALVAGRTIGGPNLDVAWRRALRRLTIMAALTSAVDVTMVNSLALLPGDHIMTRLALVAGLRMAVRFSGSVDPVMARDAPARCPCEASIYVTRSAIYIGVSTSERKSGLKVIKTRGLRLRCPSYGQETNDD
jgi:hypothetical protein